MKDTIIKEFIDNIPLHLMTLAVMAVYTLCGMILWNILIPKLFHGPHLEFLQTYGLLTLVAITSEAWSFLNDKKQRS